MCLTHPALHTAAAAKKNVVVLAHVHLSLILKNYQIIMGIQLIIFLFLLCNDLFKTFELTVYRGACVVFPAETHFVVRRAL